MEVDSYRIWASVDMLDSTSDYWIIKDLKLYSNPDCKGTNHDTKTPSSSGYWSDDVLEKLFDSDDNWGWQIILKDKNEFWIQRVKIGNDGGIAYVWVASEYSITSISFIVSFYITVIRSNVHIVKHTIIFGRSINVIFSNIQTIK